MDYLAIDIGGTRTKSAIVDSEGKLKNKENIPTPDKYEELISYIVRRFLENKIDSNTIGLSCPGVYSPINKTITGSSALSYLINKNIIDDIQSSLNDVKIIIENDGNCALLGEISTGEYDKINNILMLVVGSAIGGSAIVDGNLIRGANLNAAEFGYMMIDNNVEKSKYHSLGGKCGLNGLLNYINERGFSISNGKELFDKMSKNKELYSLVKNQLKYLALSIINLQYILDPDLVLIGGAISKNEKFINIIKDNVNEIMSLRENYKVKPKIESAKQGNDANLLGIAYKCRKYFEN